MLIRYIKSIPLAIALVMVLALPVHAEIYGPHVKQRNNIILVSTGMNLNEKSIDEIKKGVSKVIVFHIDLYRKWRAWPDEFVTSTSVSQSINCNPVKKEFKVVSVRGRDKVEKRFESCEQLLSWSMSLPDEKLSSITVLEKDATYYVRTTVESKIRKIPRVIKSVLFFVSDTEFKLTAESEVFLINQEEK
jgi:hypothetical protein